MTRQRRSNLITEVLTEHRSPDGMPEGNWGCICPDKEYCQVILVIGQLNTAQKRIKKLQKDMEEQQALHLNEISSLQKKIRSRDSRIDELEREINALQVERDTGFPG